MSFDIAKYIDIHTHILPGIDDGCTTMEESIGVAEAFAGSGVTKIVATPHYLPGTAWSPTKNQIIELVEQVQRTLDKRKIPLEVLPGMEIAYHTNLEKSIESGELLPLGESSYYLIEPSFHGTQNMLLECLSTLLEKGHNLILAHPERIDGLMDELDEMKTLVQRGLLIQVTAASLLNHFGNLVRETSLQLWREECCHFIASDTHGIDKRGPLSQDDWLTLQNDTETKQILAACNRNCAKLFDLICEN